MQTTEYVLYVTGQRPVYFSASSDRAARGMARRMIGRRCGATYQLGDEYCEHSAGRLRPVMGYCLGRRIEDGHAALYAVTAR